MTINFIPFFFLKKNKVNVANNFTITEIFKTYHKKWNYKRNLSFSQLLSLCPSKKSGMPVEANYERFKAIFLKKKLHFFKSHIVHCNIIRNDPNELLQKKWFQSLICLNESKDQTVVEKLCELNVIGLTVDPAVFGLINHLKS